MNRHTFERLRKILPWKNLLGDPADFSLDKRIFNAVNILTLAALVVLLPFNLANGLSSATFLLGLSAAMQGLLYYLARFRNKFIPTRLAYYFLTYLLLALNYYFNGGISGPTTLGFVVSFILFVVISPLRQHLFWCTAHLLLLWGLLYAEYAGFLVPQAYQDRQDHFMDLGITYGVLLVAMLFTIRYIRANYNREKTLAHDRASALEELNRERNRLFSIISHDLRTPLNAIQGYLQLLDNASLDASQRRKLEQQLLTHTNHTQDLLFNLLSWSKSQLAGSAPSLKVLNLADALSGTFSMLEPLAAKKAIGFNREVDPSITLTADEAMLQVVMRNLLHNALKYTPSGGEISVHAWCEATSCIISVKDTGTGISKEKQQDIFTSRIKSTPGTQKEKGTGLGLYLCKELMQRMSGKIYFSTTEGKGTSFMLVFPSKK